MSKSKKETLRFTPSRKYKMDDDELKMHLHLQRKGAAVHKNDKKYKRKPKHAKRDKFKY